MTGRVAGLLVAAAVAAAVGLGGAGHAVDLSIASMRATTAAPAASPSPEPTRGRRRPVVVVSGPRAKPTTTRSGQATGTAAPATTAPLCGSTPRQRDLEAALSVLKQYGRVSVDGRQSTADCSVIRGFQQRFGLAPAHGQADDTTVDVARRLVASATAEVRHQCDPGDGLTACVDLTLQTLWVVDDGAVVLGPTVVRTGLPGYATPLGSYEINKRALREWSDPYSVWLPYWQRFVGGIGFHETTTYLHDSSLGSHGCVNLLHADAVDLWTLLHTGATVHVFGRRPGT